VTGGKYVVLSSGCERFSGVRPEVESLNLVSSHFDFDEALGMAVKYLFVVSRNFS